MKGDLNRFVESSQFDLGVPEPILKAFAAAFPWLCLGVLMYSFSDDGSFRTTAKGMTMISLPFVLIGVLLPTYDPSWMNYIVYPFGVMLFIMASIVIWQRLKKPRI